MENQFDLNSWEEFLSQKDNIVAEYKDVRSPILWRGQKDSSWNLASTLERKKTSVSMSAYYRLIRRVKPSIETVTEQKWDLATHADVEIYCADYDRYAFQDLPGYEYMTHLRHHGFPTPLLDWSSSAFVAAFFAFHNCSEQSRIGIFSYIERKELIKTWTQSEPLVRYVGPYVTTHRRHFRQQSSYTLCVQHSHRGGLFVPHQSVFNSKNPNQDLVLKFTIPRHEKTKVLKYLDEFNLNSFSLFDSEESLMETLAFREIDLKLDSLY